MGGFRFCVLGSSSEGNCTLVQVAGTTFLIDAGFAGKKIREMLGTLGIAPEQIDAVFITHEHCDHSKGVAGLAKFRNIKWFASRGTSRKLADKKVEWNIVVPAKSSTFDFKDIRVRAFSIPHDSQEAVAYIFEHDGEKLAWMSDCGKTTIQSLDALQDVDILFLESNYDLNLLRNSNRPYDLKERINSSHGHLSNEQCVQFLNDLPNTVLQQLYFVHVSKECNDLALVRELCGSAASAKWGSSLTVEVVNPSETMPANARRGF
ncbi:MAG: MBL fold metallo-hydrolase [Opitutales bacterium]|nr:MBL fold metallo-hydrolase [Opitutales bacterium]